MIRHDMNFRSEEIFIARFKKYAVKRRVFKTAERVERRRIEKRTHTHAFVGLCRDNFTSIVLKTHETEEESVRVCERNKDTNRKREKERERMCE